MGNHIMHGTVSAIMDDKNYLLKYILTACRLLQTGGVVN